MADEASKHPNLPAALDRTLAVNSVRDTATPRSYLALNGCTNWGGRTVVSVPSSSCSSEATGLAAGMVGLALSEARARGLRLSAAEVLQLVRATADDVDFSTPTGVDPANSFDLGPGTRRYPSRPGWDAVHGYGRINAYELVRAVRARRIPPEVDLRSPRFFSLLPGRGTVAVTGRVAAPRARAYDLRVEWAPGFNPPAHPGRDRWRVVAERRGLRRPLDGVLGRLDLEAVAAALPGAGRGVPADPATGRSDEERFSVRVRVVVTARGRLADGPQRTPAHPDAAAYLPGWPVRVGMFQRQVLPTIGEGVGTQAAIADFLPGRPGLEVAVASVVGPMYLLGADGRSALGRVGGRDIPLKWFGGLLTGDPDGFGANRTSDDLGLVLPAFTGPAAGRLRPGPGRQVAAGTGGVSRLLDVATPEQQLPADDQLMAWDPAAGATALAGFPHETPDMAFFVTPAIVDVDGDGRREVVAGNGTFTVTAVDAEGRVPRGWPKLSGGWLVGTPAAGDWDGDGRTELAVVRRDGVLVVWRTPARDRGDWPRFGGNARNTGSPARR